MRKFIATACLGAVVLFLLPAFALAQNGSISGVVADADGEPLPGATVQIAELQIGAATDVDGRYTIESVPAGSHELTASFIGYDSVTREVTVAADERLTADFQLTEATARLGEVVVTGYRPQQARVEGGSAASVAGSTIEDVTARSPDAAIQGRAPGVRVTSASGQPGAGLQVRVRGAASINAGEDPLYIVDGIQISQGSNTNLASGNPLTAINPNDVVSIQVLKDAAAASIYGAQAANGVVIITTKQGREGPTRVSFGAQIGSVDRIKIFDVLDTEQYLDFHTRALANTAGISYDNAYETVADEYGPEGVNTNWQDEVFRTGTTQSYDLSVNGGSADTKFYISGRFSNDQGQVIASSFRQGGLRANLDHNVNDKLAVGVRTNLVTERRRGTISDGAFINSPFWSAQFIPPTAAVYNTPGDPASGYTARPNGTFSYNPVMQEEYDRRDAYVNNITASTTLTYEILPSLIAKTFAGLQHEDVDERQYRDPRIPANASVGGSATARGVRETAFNIYETLTYSQLIGDSHSLSVVGGAEFKREDRNVQFARGTGFPNNLFRTLASAAEPTDAFAAETEFRQVSFFGNTEYTYDNTYNLGATLRYDGSSRFGADNRWGLFGSIAGFWRINNMTFMDDVDWVSNLRLRASYGVTGNSQINNFESRQLYSSPGAYEGTPIIRPTGLGNRTLTWEEKRSTNLGLDFAVFQDRISLTVDFWRDNRNELLINRDLVDDSGFGGVFDNVGRIRIEGIDMALSTVNVDRAFRWQTDFNIAFERSETLELLEGDNEIVPGDGYVYRVGEPIELLRYQEYAGVNPASGFPMYYDLNGDLTYNPTDANNQVFVGNPRPDFYGGLGNQFSFQGFTLDVFFQYDYGRTTLNNNAFFSDTGYFNFNKSTRVLDFWQQPGDMTSVPKPYGSLLFGVAYPTGFTEGEFTTRYVEDASYIRLKRVRLDYQLPTSVLGYVGLNRASVYVQGENLTTWTNFTGPDPELIGTALGEYPQSKRITGGVRLGF